MVLPINKGTGTRIKIIEAMLIGARILTTKKGIEGITFEKNEFPIVQNKNIFIKQFKKTRKNKFKFKISTEFKKNILWKVS